MTKPADTLPEDISELKAIIAEHIISNKKYEEEARSYRKIVSSYREEISSYREEVRQRDERLTRQNAELTKKDEELAQARGYAERLEEMVRLLRHGRFGRKSEAVEKDDRQLPLGIFNEAEEASQESAEEATSSIEVKAHKRRGKPTRLTRGEASRSV